MRRLAVLLLVPLLAGCLGSLPGPQADLDADVPAPDVPELTGPVPLPHDVAAAEPNVAILDDDTIFVTAPVGLTYKPNAAEGAAWLWRSTDGGRSWDVLRDPHVAPGGDDLPFGAFCSCDADVVTSPDGWTYYSDWWIAGLVAGNYLVEASPDGGETWDRAPVTIPEPRNVDRQWLVPGSDGFVGLFYSYFEPSGVDPSGGYVEVDHQLQAVLSTDHGATWSAPVDVVPAEAGWAYQIGHPRWLGNDTVVMPYGAVETDTEASFWEAPSEVRVAISTDGGETWEQATVAEVPAGFDNLWAVQGDVDDAGTMHVAWAARTNATMTLFHSESPDARTWSEPEAVRSRGLNFLPWVAARGDGHVAVGWYGGNATGEPTNVTAERPWYAYVATRSGSEAAWQVQPVGDTPVKQGPLCPRGASCTSDRELLDYVSLDFSPEGRLVYALARSSTVTGAPQDALVHVARQMPS